MEEYTKRFVTRIIGCIALFGSLYLLDQIENERLKNFNHIISVLYFLVFLAFAYEIFVYLKQRKSNV